MKFFMPLTYIWAQNLTKVFPGVKKEAVRYGTVSED